MTWHGHPGRDPLSNAKRTADTAVAHLSSIVNHEAISPKIKRQGRFY
jgi:hypothetical protein